MMQRRSFLAAMLAAAVAPSFVRKIDSPLWIPAGGSEVASRGAVARFSLIGRDGTVVQEGGFEPYRNHAEFIAPFEIQRAIVAAGVLITDARGAELKRLRFTSGEQAAVSTDRIIVRVRLGMPIRDSVARRSVW